MALEKAKYWPFLVVVSVLVLASAAVAAELEPTNEKEPYVWEEDFNFGQDPLNPVWRLDIRQGFADFGRSADAFITTVRLDAIWNLGDNGSNGQLYWRNDILALVGSDVPSPDNPRGERKWGVGDMLSQTFWILPSDMVEQIPTVDAFGLGLQLEIPASSKDNTGSNQWVLSPALGGQWVLSEDGSAVLTALLFYSFDIGSRRGLDEDINQIRFQPITTFIVKDYLPFDYITFYDTDQIIFDVDNGDWFFPFQIQIGRKLSLNTIASVEYTQKLFHTGDLDLYDWQVTFRYGLFF